MHIYTKFAYYLKEFMKSLVLIRILERSHVVGPQLLYQKAMSRFMVLGSFEEAVTLGMAGSRSPKDAIRSCLYISAMLSELLAFSGRVSPSDCKHIHQPCRLVFHQLSRPNVKSTALARSC